MTETGDITRKWSVDMDSPVAAHPVRIVGEDESRFPGSVSAAGLNLLFGKSNTPVDIEVLEVTIQPTSAVTVTLGINGVPISGTWTLAANQFWSAPGFILARGQQITLFLSAAVVVVFEVRLRLYYGRQK